MGTLDSDQVTIKLNADVQGAIHGLQHFLIMIGQLNHDFQRASNNVSKGSTLMKASILGLGAALTALSGALAVSTSTYAKFEQSAANAASVTGATGEAYGEARENIEAMARELGATTVYSAQEAADALYDMASAGYDVSKMSKADLMPVLDLAAATQSDLSRSSHWVTSSLGQFGMETSEAGRITDVFAYTIGHSKATLEKLGLSMVYAGTVANSYGVTIEETSAALGVMYDRGLRGEQAGRALKHTFGSLSGPTGAAKKELDRLGISLEEVNPKYNSLAEILKKFHDNELFDMASAKIIFGEEHQAGVVAMAQDYEEIIELTGELQNAQGIAHTMAEQQLDTVQGAFTLLNSIITELKIQIGERMMPYMRGFLQLLYDYVTYLTTRVNPAFNKLIKIVGGLKPSWTALKSIFYNTKTIVSDFFGMFPGFTTSASTFIYMINTMTASVALFIQWISDHSGLIKFITTLAIAAAMVGPLGKLVLMLAKIRTALLGLSVAATIAEVQAWSLSGAIAAMGGPITIAIALVALLAAAWITNFGGMRDFTGNVVDGIVDSFWWMVEKLFNATNKITEFINKIRETAGLEKVDVIEYDIEAAKQGFRRMKTDFETIWNDFNLADILDMDFDTWQNELEESTDLVDALAEAFGVTNDEISELLGLTKEVDMVTPLKAGYYAAQSIEEREAMGSRYTYGSSDQDVEVIHAGNSRPDDGREWVKRGDTYVIVNANTSDPDAVAEATTDAVISVGGTST
jgi:TP901 family phage tail tape measure protein